MWCQLDPSVPTGLTWQWGQVDSLANSMTLTTAASNSKVWWQLWHANVQVPSSIAYHRVRMNASTRQ